MAVLHAQDPLAALDACALHSILAHLAPKDLLAACLVCKNWRTLGLDARLWDRHCKELWVGKAYVPSSIKHHSNRLTAYSRSIVDCQRSVITQDELVTFTWTFCFKHSAGPFWRVLIGDIPLRRWFHRDHTMTGPKEDPLSAAGQGQEYRWRFCRSKQHRLGTFVQINRYPSLEVRRTADWGWTMHNKWVVFAASLSEGPNPGAGNEPTHNPQLPPGINFNSAFVEAVAEAVVAAATAVGADEQAHLALLTAGDLEDGELESEEEEEEQEEEEEEEEQEQAVQEEEDEGL